MSNPPDELAALLGRHYAAGRLEADELERRLDLAFGASAARRARRPPAARRARCRRRRWGRRHGEPGAAAPTWVPTKERFIDPSTQRVMRVWVDPADHQRHYIADA